MSIKNIMSIATSASVFLVTSVTLNGLSSNKIVKMDNEVATKAINHIMYVQEEKIEDVVLDPTEETILLEEEIEIKPVEVDKIVDNSSVYTGKLTGYGADCPGCSGVVSCKTREGNTLNLVSDGTYYEDTEYGSIRILAADLSAFPCGTVVYVDNGSLEPFFGVVLDTGSSMRNAWQNGVVWMDLAHLSENSEGLYLATSSNTKFSVQRWGW